MQYLQISPFKRQFAVKYQQVPTRPNIIGLVIPVLNSSIDRILLIKREIEIVLSLPVYPVFLIWLWDLPRAF